MAQGAPVLRDTPRKRFAVILFVLSPLAVLTALCVWLYFAIKEPPFMAEPARGAGAGHTGLSNEYMGVGKGRPGVTSNRPQSGSGSSQSPAH
jgi:hypothetical protein